MQDFSGTIPTTNQQWEVRRAGALCCFQVSPRLAGAAQVQMFANTARPPSQPGGGWQPLSIAILGSSRRGCLCSAPESKEPLIVEELCSETLISCKSGLHTLSGEHFTF